MMMPTIPNKFDSYNIRVRTPDGTMFVTIAEENNKAKFILINIGKNGSRLVAWATATTLLANSALENGVSITKIARDLLGISTDSPLIRPNEVEIKSGPDGLGYALLTYAAQKTYELERSLGTDTDDGRYDWLDDRGAFPRE